MHRPMNFLRAMKLSGLALVHARKDVCFIGCPSACIVRPANDAVNIKWALGRKKVFHLCTK